MAAEINRSTTTPALKVLSTIKLYKQLTKSGESEASRGLNKIIIKLSSFNDLFWRPVIETFQSEFNDLFLVVEWDLDEAKTNSNELKDKISEIINVMEFNDENQLIIISQEKDILKKYFPQFSATDTIIDIKNTFTNYCIWFIFLMILTF